MSSVLFLKGPLKGNCCFDCLSVLVALLDIIIWTFFALVLSVSYFLREFPSDSLTPTSNFDTWFLTVAAVPEPVNTLKNLFYATNQVKGLLCQNNFLVEKLGYLF